MAHHQPLDEEFSSRVLDSVQRNFLLPLLSRVTRGNTHTDGALGEVARAPHQRSCRRGMEAAVVQDRVRRGCAGSGGRSLAKCGGAGGGRGGPRKRETWELESRAGKENGTGEVVDETRAGGVGEPEQLHVRAASSLLCPDLPSPAQEQLRPHKAVMKIRKRHLLWVSKLGKWSSSSENRPHRMRRRGSFPLAFIGQHGPTKPCWLASR